MKDAQHFLVLRPQNDLTTADHFHDGMKKSTARYILRFDDICPTMNWRVWSDVEDILNGRDIHPIVAVVPDNRDPKLIIDAPADDFWDRVRNWQSRGWSIGLHGYQHTYVTRQPGMLLQPNRRSEFAGLPREVQANKLAKGLDIFRREGVKADCWVAPAHTFDLITVDLLNQFGVKVISDGFWPWPHTDKRGITWVPHQLALLERKQSGVWGVGYHINSWNRDQVALFRKTINSFTPSISALSEVVSMFHGRRLTVADTVNAMSYLAWYCWIAPFLRRSLHRVDRIIV